MEQPPGFKSKDPTRVPHHELRYLGRIIIFNCEHRKKEIDWADCDAAGRGEVEFPNDAMPCATVLLIARAVALRWGLSL